MLNQKKLLKSLVLTIMFMTITTLSVNSQHSTSKQETLKISKAICVIYPTKGNQAYGTVTFTRMGNSVHVVAELHGLTKGKHGFHIHEFGDCNSPDGNSAGGHFNPEKMEHGAPMADMRHAGDMGNIEADENGDARLDYMDSKISFEGLNSIIGRSMIVHASEDDLKTQPTGAAGARIGCGVIGVAKE